MATKKTKAHKNTKGPKKKTATPQKKRVVSSTPPPPKVEAKAKTPPRKKTPEVQLPFTRKNYILLLIGVGLIAFGFLLMSMDDFVDAKQFSISLYIAPPIVVAGFLEIIYAIMYKDTSTPIPED